MKCTPTLLIFLTLLLVSSSPAFSETEKYRVAAILPLSGQVASLGTYVRKGIELAIEDLSNVEREKLEVVFEDDQFDPVKTIGAYRKLKAMGKVDAVFVVGSPPANALGPITEKDRTLLMAIGASDPSIAIGKEYSFIHWVTPRSLGEKLASEIVKRNFSRIAFVVADVSGAIADAKAAIAALEKHGFGDRIVFHQNFLKETTDYRSVLTRIHQKKADAIVAVLFSGALSSFAKQLRQMHIPAELAGMETFEDEAEVKASNGALLGAWYVNASDNTSTFVDEYKEKYNEIPGWGAGNGYDSLRLIASAIEEGALDNSAVRDYLRSIKNYSGVTGTYSASGDNRFTLPAALKRVTKDGFKSLQ